MQKMATPDSQRYPKNCSAQEFFLRYKLYKKEKLLITSRNRTFDKFALNNTNRLFFTDQR